MLKLILIIATLVLATGGTAHAQDALSGMQMLQQAPLMRAQAEALQAWTRCMQATNDANKCGPPPQTNQTVVNQAVPRSQYQVAPVTPFGNAVAIQVSCTPGQSVTGQSVWLGTYRVPGGLSGTQVFTRAFPAVQGCPASLNVY